MDFSNGIRGKYFERIKAKQIAELDSYLRGIEGNRSIVESLMMAFDQFYLMHNKFEMVDEIVWERPYIAEIVKRLTDPQNRTALKSWYLNREMNARAKAFREYLSNKIGEPL